jgi:hypothetical protein
MLDSHGSPGDVQKMIEIISSHRVAVGDCTPLDMSINEITKREKSKLFPYNQMLTPHYLGSI